MIKTTEGSSLQDLLKKMLHFCATSSNRKKVKQLFGLTVCSRQAKYLSKVTGGGNKAVFYSYNKQCFMIKTGTSEKCLILEKDLTLEK